MSLWQKSALGPGRVVKCRTCGKPVAAHWTGILAAIPAFLGGYALMTSGDLPLGIVAVIGGVFAMGLLHTFLVPLVRGDA